MKPLKWIGEEALYRRLHRADVRAGRDLTCVQDRTDALGPRGIPLVACLRNERFRMPAFAAHYRRLGVGHFLLIDNGSDDGLMDWAREQPDVSVWRTEASYRDSAFGMLWCNDLLRRHAAGRWAVCVDPDEFLVIPHGDARDLRDLAEFLDEDRQVSLPCLMIDAYARGPLSEARLGEGDDPFAVCPWFDRDGYVQTPGPGAGVFIRGGPRLRVHFADRPEAAPALNKIPFVRWTARHHYVSSMHDGRPFFMNRGRRGGADRDLPRVTGALFHFKFVAALRDKAAEEAERGQHYAGGREYARYREDEAGDFWREGLSVRYEGPEQLERLGLISAGRWF